MFNCDFLHRSGFSRVAHGSWFVCRELILVEAAPLILCSRSSRNTI